jgi:gluconate 5-dehydrogenase
MAAPDRFAGKVALVTGAARGIGRATAELLASQGAWIVLADLDGTALTATGKDMDAAGHQVLPVQLDVTDADALETLFTEIQAWSGGLDILVNNAGMAIRAGLDETDEEQFRRQMEVNVTSVFALSRRAAILMRAQGGGAIVNLASVLSLIARPGISAYVTSKGAVAALTRALAVELSPDSIRVNAVGPGYIATDPMVPLQANADFNDHLLGRTPLGRWGRPDEIAKVIAFLASEESSFIQGQVIIADGGLSIAL